MQDEQKKFQEKLSELLSYARDHENKVTMKEVRDFFEDFALDEQKVTFVCEYLTMEQVDVADYEPGVVPEETEKEKKKPEFSEEKHKDNTVVNKVNRLKDAIEELSDGDDMDFSVAELSAYLDMSVEEIEDILRIAGEEP